MKLKGLLATMFAAALALTMFGCADNQEQGTLDEPLTSAQETVDTGTDAAEEDAENADTTGANDVTTGDTAQVIADSADEAQ